MILNQQKSFIKLEIHSYQCETEHKENEQKN